VITLPDAHRAAIARHGEADHPEECCGLMIGTFGDDGRKVVVDLLPISNAREQEARRNRFLIGPGEMLRGERHARALGLDIVGIYHSHPDCPAVPSQFDLDHAWPVFSYIIVSVSANGAGEMRSWELREDRSGFDPETIVASDDASQTAAPTSG
jgi:proteasome lid subunit RPN8/RPN11